MSTQVPWNKIIKSTDFEDFLEDKNIFHSLRSKSRTHNLKPEQEK